MADEQAADSESAKQLLLQKIYVKDISFESPRAPDCFAENLAPETQLNIRSNARQVGTDSHEVTLTLTVEAKSEDKTLFICELEQAGVFLIKGYAEQEQRVLIGSFCPATLYPFAREVIADLVTRGGFPQLLLQPINFDALYAQALQQGQPAGSDAVN